MANNFYGKTMKLYGANLSGEYSQEAAMNAFDNKEFIQNINCGFPILNDNFPLPEDELLFNSLGRLNEETVARLNLAAPAWQKMPVFYSKYSQYISATSFDKAIELFDNALCVDDYPYDLLFISDDNLDFAQVFRVSDANFTQFGFKVSTHEVGNQYHAVKFVSVITFGDDDYLNMIWSSLCFKNSNSLSLNILTSEGYAASGQRNSWWLGWNFQFGIFSGAWEGYEEGYKPGGTAGSNPYENIDRSGTGGGDGSGNPGGDIIPEPTLPTNSALGTKLVKMYAPTVSQLRDFGAWLWSDFFDLETLKRLFSDPMDMILGLNLLPVIPPTGSTEPIVLGNLTSDVSAAVVSQQYIKFDLGSVTLRGIYNSYLDFAPYTKVQIFLPYIGMRTLNADELINRDDESALSIHVKYTIDLLSGACVAHILVGGSLMYEFGGSCGSQIPLTGRNFSSVVQGIVGAVGAVAMSVAGAGVAGVGLSEAALAVGGAGAIRNEAAASAIAGAGREVVSSKVTIEHASGITGCTGYISSQSAYLIVERARLCYPAHQQHYTGYPGFIYSKVSQLRTGYAKFVNIEIVNVHATEPELQELKEWFIEKGIRI